MYTIRAGHESEIAKFQLANKDNEGQDIIVAELEGEVVAFAQVTGCTIFFIESEARGAGTAIVDHMKAASDYLVADNVNRFAAGYWEKVGFSPCGRNNYEWYAEDYNG